MEDDVSQATMLMIEQADGGAPSSSFWLANDNGIIERVVTSDGDHLIWSS